MPKFQVKIHEVYSTIVTVEANDEDETDARIQAATLANIGALPDGMYDYVLELDEWEVRSRPDDVPLTVVKS